MNEYVPYVSPERHERRSCPYKEGDKVYFCVKHLGKTMQWDAVVTSARSARIGSGYVIYVHIEDADFTGRRSRKVNFPPAASHNYIFHRD